MNKTQLINSVARTFHKAGFQLKKHSPEILVATGVISTIAGVAMACKATLKVNEVVDEAKNNIDIIHESTEVGLTPGNVPYSAEDSKKDLAIVYTQTGLKLAKLYAPAAIALTAGVGCMLASHGIMHKRNAALAAAYTVVDKSFKEYRGRVAEKFGKDIEKELKYGLKTEEVEMKVVDENGKEKTVKETVTTSVLDQYSEYAKFFDDGCKGWDKDAEYNKAFLRGTQMWANDLLAARGYVFLNEIYDALGIPRTKAGQVVGWTYDPKNPNVDSYIDFGMYDIWKEGARDFVNGREKTILLDFNVEGYILDKVSF